MKVTIGLDTATATTTLSRTDSAKILKSIGFDGIDYGLAWFHHISTVTNPEAKEAIIKEMLGYKELGLEISQTHLHYLSSEFYGPGKYPEFEQKYLDALISEIEICGAAGCPVAVLHTYFEEDREATIRSNKIFFDKILPHLEKNNVKLALENVYGGGDKLYAKFNNATAEDFMVYFEDYKSPYLGACLDTGHANCVKESAVDMAKTFGKYLIATHLSSNAGRDTHVMPGMVYDFADPINWVEFSKTLKGIGYEGTYNLEICAGNYPHDVMDGIHYLQMAYGIGRRYADLAE